MHLIDLLESDMIYIDQEFSSIEEGKQFLLNEIVKFYHLKEIKKFKQSHTLGSYEQSLHFLCGASLYGYCLEQSPGIYTAVAFLNVPLFDEDHYVSMITVSFFNLNFSFLYNKIVLGMARLLAEKAVWDALIIQKNKKDTYQLIQQQNIVIQKKAIVGEICWVGAPYCHIDQKFGQVIELFIKTKIPAMAVVDKNEQFVGFLRLSNIMSQFVPEYGNQIQDLGFNSSVDMIQSFYTKIQQFTLKDFLEKQLYINYNDSILEGIGLLLKYHSAYLPVVDSKHEYKGLLSHQDIISKINQQLK